jgi:ATP phosphoribosyltransferase regulatory subunit
VLRAIVGGEHLAPDRLDEILRALNSKDVAALQAAVQGLGQSTREALLKLADLHGGLEVLARARRELPADGELGAALSQLEQLAALCPRGTAGIDLADLHGYRYYTGATYAAYVAGSPGAILRGGRYDEIGRIFGRARPATGFSIVDLREAAQLSGPKPLPKAIVAPFDADHELETLVTALRAKGEIVVRAADGRMAEGVFEFDRDIRRVGAKWEVVARGAKPGGG